MSIPEFISKLFGGRPDLAHPIHVYVTNNDTLTVALTIGTAVLTLLSFVAAGVAAWGAVRAIQLTRSLRREDDRRRLVDALLRYGDAARMVAFYRDDGVYGTASHRGMRRAQAEQAMVTAEAERTELERIAGVQQAIDETVAGEETFGRIDAIVTVTLLDSDPRRVSDEAKGIVAEIKAQSHPGASASSGRQRLAALFRRAGA